MDQRTGGHVFVSGAGVCACTLPVLLLSEDWNDRRLEDGDLHQSCVLLGGLAVIVGYHQQLPGKHTTLSWLSMVSQRSRRQATEQQMQQNTTQMRTSLFPWLYVIGRGSAEQDECASQWRLNWFLLLLSSPFNWEATTVNWPQRILNEGQS